MAVQHGIAAANSVTPRGSTNALCFLVDEDFAVRQDIARELRRRGIDVVEFSGSARLEEMVDDQKPDIVFVDLNRKAPHNCVRALLALKECRYSGAVQLVGQAEAAMLESFKTIGTDCALAMLPPLAKPIGFTVIHRIIQERKLLAAGAPSATVSLDAALAGNMVSFLYQPKFALRTGTIVGAELLVRVTHPEYGLLTPDRFLKGADEDALLKLSRLALVEAILSGAKFLKSGIALSFSANIGAVDLLQLPIADLALMHRPEASNWPGVILEVPAQQFANKAEALKTRSPRLQQAGVSIAIDNFGARAFQLDLLNQFPVAEIKIDRALVESSPVNSGGENICKTIVQMAHNFGCKAVAVGISTEADLHRFAEFGCDMGQGFLFGKPLNWQQLLGMVAGSKTQRTEPSSAQDGNLLAAS
jgi:EAL domain-containing protein (putative c-di-GMP-specific phosphodiesterase class I)